MITAGKSLVVMGIRDPFSPSLSDTHDTNSQFVFSESYLKDAYEKAIEAEVDILHIISCGRANSRARTAKAHDIKQTCYVKAPATKQKNRCP